MRIIIDKKLQPQLRAKLEGIKSMESYNFSGYSQTQSVLTAPSSDLVLNVAVDIARLGAIVEAYPYWVEVPDGNLGDDVPAGVSFETYIDEFDVEQTRTWAELGLNTQGDTNSLRFWQPSNNGQFLFEDVEIIQEAGFTVYGKQSLQIRLNDDEYADTGDPEYTVLETIEYIDETWRFGGYFDMLDAYLSMTDVYEALGIDDNARWAACTDDEKLVIVRWNIVGLGKAGTIVDGSWSEARQFKEISRWYREFNINMNATLSKRFNDWYQYLNTVLDASGQTQFAIDWNWNFKDDYIHRYLRQFDLSATNSLVNFNNVTLTANFTDSDFFGSIPAATFIAALDKVLTNKKYSI